MAPPTQVASPRGQPLAAHSLSASPPGWISGRAPRIQRGSRSSIVSRGDREIYPKSEGRSARTRDKGFAVRRWAIVQWVRRGTNVHGWALFVSFQTGQILTCTAQFLSVTAQSRHNCVLRPDRHVRGRRAVGERRRATTVAEHPLYTCSVVALDADGRVDAEPTGALAPSSSATGGQIRFGWGKLLSRVTHPR